MNNVARTGFRSGEADANSKCGCTAKPEHFTSRPVSFATASVEDYEQIDLGHAADDDPKNHD